MQQSEMTDQPDRVVALQKRKTIHRKMMKVDENFPWAAQGESDGKRHVGQSKKLFQDSESEPQLAVFTATALSSLFWRRSLSCLSGGFINVLFGGMAEHIAFATLWTVLRVNHSGCLILGVELTPIPVLGSTAGMRAEASGERRDWTMCNAIASWHLQVLIGRVTEMGLYATSTHQGYDALVPNPPCSSPSKKGWLLLCETGAGAEANHWAEEPSWSSRQRQTYWGAEELNLGSASVHYLECLDTGYESSVAEMEDVEVWSGEMEYSQKHKLERRTWRKKNWIYVSKNAERGGKTGLWEECV
ncbi:uncharacterized protein EV420DRAFT_1486405 [Desarmillaria tabescens]|uniref:Uncharacterized protein n=1 Tax=Armillaria tabescens TaxID=1929756 RepID=A0AA39JAM6_ARMTA|nr:uncharacterized protein EV420DRAFT_1486405 [Desarmillaria tabescens]KAK0439266.1 hypothetical protein EV420DRAFT_1486405 [Desarmillaria tabescens]